MTFFQKAAAGMAAGCILLCGQALAQQPFPIDPPAGGQQQQPQQQQPQQQPYQGQQQPQPYPGQQQPGGYPGQQPQPGMNPGMGQGMNLDQLAQMERQDYGIAPSRQLHTGQFHGPTPSSIPGGQLITTKGVLELVQGRQMPFVLLDVLGGPQMIPGARPAVQASQPGSFSDQNQQQFAGYLQQLTNGRKDVPIILYCQSTQCWMSYNAALRAINAGYTNVLWYRGGIEAWQMAGQQVTGGGTY